MKKILITGGKGVLAQYITRVLRKNNTVVSPDHAELDVTNKKLIEFFFRKNEPDFVIHTAAKTGVDDCEREPSEAFIVNSEGTKNIAEACKRFSSFLIYISTAAVFNGKKDFFYEDDETNPINIYGKSKLGGEKAIQNILKNYTIVRAPWLIGGGKKEKKFVSHIVEQSKKKSIIQVVQDKVGTIAYAKELAEFLEQIIKKNIYGVYHFASRGACSRLDIAHKILEIIKSDARIEPVSSEYFINSFFAPRPNREVLVSKKIKHPKTWEESLVSYMQSEIIH